MKLTKKLFYVSTICLTSISIQGCLVAGIGAGIGAAKYGGAKQTEAQAKTRSAYNEYVIEMQKINLQRNKANLKAEPIMSYDEYVGIPVKKK